LLLLLGTFFFGDNSIKLIEIMVLALFLSWITLLVKSFFPCISGG